MEVSGVMEERWVMEVMMVSWVMEVNGVSTVAEKDHTLPFHATSL